MATKGIIYRVGCWHCGAGVGDLCVTDPDRFPTSPHGDRNRRFFQTYADTHVIRAKVTKEPSANNELAGDPAGDLRKGDIILVHASDWPDYLRIIYREYDGAGPSDLGDRDGDVRVEALSPIDVVTQYRS